MNRIGTVVALAIAWIAANHVLGHALAETWNQFRGAQSGIADGAELPTHWSKDQHVVWKVRVPGVGTG